MDQFSRNVYRDTPRAFAQDALALVLAQELVACRGTAACPGAAQLCRHAHHAQRVRIGAGAQAVALFSQPGIEDSLRFELRHQSIIDRFGRHPQRNAILGRTSTAEALVFLSELGSSF